MDRKKIILPHVKDFIRKTQVTEYGMFDQMNMLSYANKSDLSSVSIKSVERGDLDLGYLGRYEDAIVGDVIVMCMNEANGDSRYFVSMKLIGHQFGGAEILRMSLHTSYIHDYEERTQIGSKIYEESKMFETAHRLLIKSALPDFYNRVTSRSAWWRARMFPKVREEGDCDECLTAYNECYHYRRDLKVLGIDKK